MTAAEPSDLRIVLFGATGFIGGSLLHALVTSPLPSSNPKQSHAAAPASRRKLHLTVVVGSPSKAQTVRSWLSRIDRQQRTASAAAAAVSPDSVQVVEAPRRDADDAGPWYLAAERLASDADLVVQAATSDDLRLTRSINAGLEAARRGAGEAKLRRNGNLIHLSGVQLIESEPVGELVEVREYDDMDLEALASIPDSAAHREIDLDIVRAVSEGRISGSIVCPALVWGPGLGPVSRMSVQLPDMVKKALYNDAAVYCGKGTNEWPNVHISDLVTLLLHLVSHHLFSSSSSSSSAAPSSPPAPHSTFYFASHARPHTFGDVARGVGDSLHSLRLLPSAEARSVAVPAWDPSHKGVRVEDDARAAASAAVDAGRAEVERRTPLWPCRTTCRCRSVRAEREFGWRAQTAWDHAAIVADVRHCVEVWQEEFADRGGVDVFRRKA